MSTVQKLNETPVLVTETRTWSISNIIAIIAALGTLLAAIGTFLEVVKPSWGVWVSAAGALILSITGRVQGTPIK